MIRTHAGEPNAFLKHRLNHSATLPFYKIETKPTKSCSPSSNPELPFYMDRLAQKNPVISVSFRRKTTACYSNQIYCPNHAEHRAGRRPELTSTIVRQGGVNARQNATDRRHHVALRSTVCLPTIPTTFRRCKSYHTVPPVHRAELLGAIPAICDMDA